MILQPISPVPLTENWKLLTRPTLPVIFSTDVPVGRRYDSSESADGTMVILKSNGEAVFDDCDGLGDRHQSWLFIVRRPMLSGRLIIGRFGLFATPHRRRYQRPILAVGGKYTQITSEIDPGPGHQGDQPGNEVQRLENHVGGARESENLEDRGGRITTSPVFPPLWGVRNGCHSSYSLDPLLFISEVALEDRVTGSGCPN
jgi:hypothetical protein